MMFANNNNNNIVAQSVQTLIINALQASEASSSEATNSLNALLEAERSLLPEIADQLKRSNRITDEVFETLINAQKAQDEIQNTRSSDAAEKEEETFNAYKCVEAENREKLKKYYEERMGALEQENGELYSNLLASQQQQQRGSNNNEENNSNNVLGETLAQIKNVEHQVSDLLEKAKSSSKKERKTDEDDDEAAVDQDGATATKKIKKNNNQKTAQQVAVPSWTKDAWYLAFEQLKEKAQNSLEPEEANKIRADLDDIKSKHATAVNRGSMLETDVNSLRFSNAVLKEQLLSVLMFSEKMMMILGNSNNNNSNNSFSIPQEIQQIIQQRRNNNNNNNSLPNKSSNALTPPVALRAQDFLSSSAAGAAIRAVENAEDVSSSARKVSNDSGNGNYLSQSQVHLGAFAFDDVKQMVERFEELSQALYTQELDKEKKNNNSSSNNNGRKVDNSNNNDEGTFVGDDGDNDGFKKTRRSGNNDNNTTTFVVTDDRGIQTDERLIMNETRNNNNENSLDDDSDSSSMMMMMNNGQEYNQQQTTTSSSLEIHSDPQIFNALREITLNLESGFAVTSQSEAELNQLRLKASRDEVAELQNQLQTASDMIQKLAREKSECIMKERVSSSLVEKLKSQLKDQVAAEVQVPMLKEVPAILSRFESILSTIASHNENEKDEKSAQGISRDSMKRHVSDLNHVMGRLQEQYTAFDQLLTITSSSSSKNNQQHALFLTADGSASNNNNPASYDALVTSLKTRVSDLEKELEAQSQDLETERSRTIEQLERMFKAEEQARELTRDMQKLKTTAVSSEQAQELRNEITNLENRNSQNSQTADRTANDLRSEILVWKTKCASLQENHNEANERSKVFETEKERAVAESRGAIASLENAHKEITRQSRLRQEADERVQQLTVANNNLTRTVANLQTDFLTKETVREEFSRMFPNDSAGSEALSRLAHLDQELRSKSEELRSVNQAKHELENNLAIARDQLQQSESERLTNKMKTATAESNLKRLQETSGKELAALTNEVSYLRQDCQRIGIERDAAVERAQMLTRHVDVLSQDQLSANARLYGLSETRSFTEQMKEIHERNTTLQDDLAAARDTIAIREQTVTETQSQLTDSRKTVSTLERDVQDATELVQDVSNQLAACEEKLKSTVEQLETTRGQLHTMTHDRDEKQRRVEDLEDTVQTLEQKKSSLEADKTKLEQEVENLKQVVEDRDQIVAEARRAVENGGGGGGQSNNNNNGSSSMLSGSFTVGSNSNSNNIGRFTNALNSI